MSTIRVIDAELARLAADGDTAAFGELVARHQPAAFRAALAALGSRADAEDALQDAFLAAFRRLRSFRGEASFKTWLLAIVWHTAINRRRRIRWWLRRAADPADDPPDRESSPEASAAGAEMRRAVVVEIRALTPKLRDALLLAAAGDYSYEEMAAMLRIPLGTLKWRISEARRLVRARLGARGHVIA